MANSVGVIGSATASTTRSAILGLASGGASTVLEGSGGVWKTDNSTLVTNLNADLLDGQHAAAFVNVNGALGTPSSGNLANCTFPTLNQNTTGNAATASNASLLGGLASSAFVQVASGTTNGKYIYYVNNTGAPTNPVTRAAWILISTNDGATVYLPGYV